MTNIAAAVSDSAAVATERILIMNSPVKAEVDDATREALTGLSLGDPDLLAEGLELRASWKERSGLTARSYALVKIAALIALDAPPASEGVSPSDILGVLVAIAPQVGGPRIVAAAPEIMLALGLALPDDV